MRESVNWKGRWGGEGGQEMGWKVKGYETAARC